MMCAFGLYWLPQRQKKANLKKDGDGHAMYNNKGKLYTYRSPYGHHVDPPHRLPCAHT